MVTQIPKVISELTTNEADVIFAESKWGTEFSWRDLRWERLSSHVRNLDWALWESWELASTNKT